MQRKNICVFCGSSEVGAKKYADVAIKLGEAIVDNGYGLVYGGGNVGLMKIIADTVLEKGGDVIGVITPEVRKLGVVHSGIKPSNLHEEKTYSNRKAKMAELSAAFIVLPGGLGTLDELTEVAITNQFASYENKPEFCVKPCALLNADGFFDGLFMQFERACKDTFMTQKHLNMIFQSTDPMKIIEHIVHFKNPSPDKTEWWKNKPAAEKTTSTNFWNKSRILTGLFFTGVAVKVVSNLVEVFPSKGMKTPGS